MSGPSFLTRFRRDQRGSVAEFALVLPLAVLFLLGLVDAGRFLYEVNRHEKATQAGARFAVVTNPVLTALSGESYVGVTVGGVTLTQGDRIPAGALGLVTCTSAAACTCTTAPCPATLTRDAAFTNLVARMSLIDPSVSSANVIVEYRGSGLGYAGDPNGMDIAPLVTVRLTGITFEPFLLFGGDINLSSFSYTLTMEDGQGTGSN